MEERCNTRKLARYRINATCINDDMQVCVNILTPLRVHNSKLYSDLATIRGTRPFHRKRIYPKFEVAGSTTHLDLQQLAAVDTVVSRVCYSQMAPMV